MAEVFMPRQPQLGLGIGTRLDGLDSTPLPTATASIRGPRPNPPFTFPPQSDASARGEPHSRSTSTITPAVSSRASNRSRPSQLSINALPAFDFGAGSSPTRTAMSSPTRSPAEKGSPLAHGSGHRRGGSEFIGGDASNGGPMLVGSSPTTPDPTIPSLSGPRRGHAHRRSGAVSQTEISMIMGGSKEHMGGSGSGSAPTTPSELVFHRPQIHEIDRTISQPAYAVHRLDRPMALKQNASVEEVPRSRVGFSEVLEYIPRPLSTISSDTSSSVSTVRPSHSVTDSITSFVSGGTTSPPSLRVPRPSSGTPDHSLVRSRAGTCSSISSSIAEGDKRSGPAALEPLDRPSSAPVGEGSFAHESSGISTYCGSSSLLSSPMGLSVWNEGFHQRLSPKNNARPARPRTSPEPKVTKRQRKVRSWTGLLRKGKQSLDSPASADRQPPLTSQRSVTRAGEFSLDNVTFDDDTTCIIESVAPSVLPISSTQPKPYSGAFDESYEPEIEHADPVIDIDLALGTLDPPFDEGFPSNAKRRMHSSGETGGFSGPGMHYHRRTESAPEMEVFDRSRFGFPRLGSNPAMTEAIEEEEEDGTHVIGIEEEDEASGLGVNIIETDPPGKSPVKRRPRREASVDQELQRRTPVSERHDNSECFQGVEIVTAEEEPRFSVITKSSDDSTITPTLSHDPIAPGPEPTPIDFAMQTPSLVYSTSETASALSSADYSKTSFDVPDIPQSHTASSSITDRVTLNSSRAGDPGLGSVDDVPSLTSSASTMPTRFSSSSNSNAVADRSYSLSAAIPSRARPDAASKRSSLASLSRLVGSSYNKSKLHISEPAPPDSPQKHERRRHRLSRMMKFWKSKEKLSST